MIKVRFAPSPTGGLHVGSIKTALINYLFAKKNDGQFLLRVEDTDKQRSTSDYVKHIEEGLNILGLHHDGNICYQSKNASRHVEVAHQLLSAGKAYKCYATSNEIESFKAQNPGKKFISKWRDARFDSDGDSDLIPSSKLPYVIRLRIDHDNKTAIDDMVQGRVEVDNHELDDMVLLRSDGTPTYMLAVVVDDFDMGITHVIRGNDHFTNTFRQLQLYDAMNWDIPKFMHIPLMHGEDGRKLSKRHGATRLDELMEEGYLIESVINYLLLLGVGFDDPEIFDMQHAIKNFDHTKISKSPARFDYAKLRYVNSQHINGLTDDEILQYLDSHIADLSTVVLDRIKTGVPLIKERAEVMLDTIGLAMLFKGRADPIDQKSADILQQFGNVLVPQLRKFLNGLVFVQSADLKSELKDFAKQHDLKFSQILQLLRAVVLGTFASPGIIDMMIILGKDEVLRRFG